MKIALDAMGGDQGPEVVVLGMARALQAFGDMHCLMVGDQELLRPLIDQHAADALCNGRVEIRHASGTIRMEDSLAALRAKKNDASIFVAVQQVKSGAAQAVVSIGNTMAAYAAARMELGTLPGISKPGIAVPMPSKHGVCIVIDMGANINCRPQHLVDYAVMASEYSRLVFGVARPRVGLLNVGGEQSKGDEVLKATNQMLAKAPVNFCGNAEGDDVFNGTFDVIVCDGFVGNVLLKAAEGAIGMVAGVVREGIASSVTHKVGALLLRRVLRDVKKRTNYAEYGGAPLLGVNGICIIGHGKSDEHAIYNAVRVAREAVLKDLNESIMAVGQTSKRSTVSSDQ